MLHIFPKQTQSPNIFLGGILGLEPVEYFLRGDLIWFSNAI